LKIIQNIRERFARSFLLEHQHELVREKKQVNLGNARTLALLYYLPDEDTYKKAELIVTALSDLGLKTRVVCYTDLNIAPHYFIPKISQDIITAKDVNWRYQPVKPFAKEFINTDFDILIDLSLNEYLPLYYCAALSKAVLKVGRFREDEHHVYDLMIHSAPEDTIDSFAEQVIHYLKRINN
jgi:hypothetical protein